MKYLSLLLLMVGVLASGCGEDEIMNACDDQMLPTLDEYIATNMLTATAAVDSAFLYTIVDPGDGERPSATSMVNVQYKGYRTDGFVFDQTKDDVFNGTGGIMRDPFTLGNLIPGWQLGIPLVGAGGKIRLFLPSNLAYGTQTNISNICPNTPLIFDIELVSFTQ